MLVCQYCNKIKWCKTWWCKCIKNHITICQMSHDIIMLILIFDQMLIKQHMWLELPFTMCQWMKSHLVNKSCLIEVGPLTLSFHVPTTNSHEFFSLKLLEMPSSVFKLDNFTKMVKNLLLSKGHDPNLQYVRVLGKGGVGNTHLAQRVHNSIYVQQHFQKVFWLIVGQNPQHNVSLLQLEQQIVFQIWITKLLKLNDNMNCTNDF
jgi:hypothetical protein